MDISKLQIVVPDGSNYKSEITLEGVKFYFIGYVSYGKHGNILITYLRKDHG